MVREADNNLLARFEEYLVRLGLSPATVVNYLADMRGVARWCVESGQGCSLLNLTTDDVRAYCQYLRRERGLSPATVNRHLQAIHSWWNIHCCSIYALCKQNQAEAHKYPSLIFTIPEH